MSQGPRTEEAIRPGLDSERAVDFIDEFLSENGWRLDSRSLDFALDLRAMLDQEVPEELVVG